MHARRTHRYVTAVIGAFMLAFGAVALANHPVDPGPQLGAAVAPTGVEGNPTCSDFYPDSTEFKIEPVDSGPHDDGTFFVDVDVYEFDDGTWSGDVFDFEVTSDHAVVAVVAKGGSNANLYDYDALGMAVDEDVELHAPHNNHPRETNRFYGLSHISFCYVDDAPTEPEAECPFTLVLTPSDAENDIGDTHTVVATVTDEDGEPCDAIDVLFEVDPEEGADPSSGTATTDENGQASFSYTRGHESEDTITACTSDEGEAPASCDDAEVTIKDSANKTWVQPPEPSECPAKLRLTPAERTNQVGDPHEVIARVSDPESFACPGIGVRFEVSSDGNPTPSGAVVTTDQHGEASFTWTNDTPGTDTVTACTTSEGTAPESCAEVDSVQLKWTATKHWEGGTVEPTPAFCRARVVHLFDETLILFEANEDGTPCMTDDGSLLNLGQIRLARAETDGDETSAIAEVLGIGGQAGDPGGITLVGASADCDGTNTWILIIEQDGEALLSVGGEGSTIPLPNLALDDDNGIFFTREGDGKAQAVAIVFDGDTIVALAEAEAHCPE